MGFEFFAKDTPKQVQDIAGDGVVPEDFLAPSTEVTTDGDGIEASIEGDEYSSSVPIIDLSALVGESSDLSAPLESKEMEVIKEIGRACKEWGFFQVVNHGIPNELVQKIKQLAFAYFHMPAEDRVIDWATLPLPKSGVRDWNDALFHFCKPPQPDFASRSKVPDGYREVMSEYIDETVKLCNRLQRALSISLGLKPAVMEEYMGELEVVARVNFYPPCPNPELVSGLAAHSDMGMMTVLSQNEVEGLQVRKGKRWISVPAIPDALVINVGDILQMVSNGEFISCEHRAVVNQHSERLSLATFLYPPKNLPVGPLPDLVDEQHPALYKAVSVKEYYERVQRSGLEGKNPLEAQRIPVPEAISV